MTTKILSNNILKDIDVLILSGGQGTRLREIVNDRPKMMAEINERPFLDILINYISKYGFRRFILCVGYMANSIEKYYNKKEIINAEILFSKEGKPLGTGGAIKNAEKFIQSDSFLVVNGDSFCPINFLDFFNFYNKKSALTSMVVVEGKDNKDTGSVILDDSQKIIQFQEKENNKKAFVNAGIYFFKKEILSLIPPQINYSLEYSLFPKLIGQEFYAYVVQKKLIDIGTPERYLKAKDFFTNYE